MADERTPVLEMRGFSVGYTDAPIVRDFSAAFALGSVTCLIGGNGAGKSTLLKSIFGLNRVFSGSLHYEGEQIQRLSTDARLRRGISFVPQGRCNFPMMTVRENLEMGAFTLPRDKVSPAIDRVAELFPMLRLKWKEWAGNLSGGEQQILEMAMALETEPKLLLLDEPSLGLAPKIQDQVFGTVESIRTIGVTIILVEQNVHEALAISDTAIVMDLGAKFLEGRACQVKDDPRIRAAYLGGAVAN